MIVKPRPGFEFPIKVLDVINPFLVIISITGLFLEYTPIKSWVIPFNQIIDLIFVMDFVIRLVCHKPGKYFVHGYGWVDFLASLPGILLLLQYTPMMAIFKFVRIGRFFKIIRVLRFLRIFNFLKRMKNESAWIQDRIMKIGVSIVLVFVVGIFFMDSALKISLDAAKIESYQQAWAAAGKDAATLASRDLNLVMYTKGGEVFAADGTRLIGAAALKWDSLVNDEVHWYLEIPLSDQSFYPGPMVRIPSDGLLVQADDLMARHDTLMLILLGTLVGLLFVVIFYLGAIFANDMKGVHLIIDSVEAGDYALLQEEARRHGDGDLEVSPDENEMDSLLKVAARLSENAGTLQESDEALLSRYGMGGEATPTAGGELAPQLEAIEDRLARIETQLDRGIRDTVQETIRASAPAIVKYLRKLDTGK